METEVGSIKVQWIQGCLTPDGTDTGETSGHNEYANSLGYFPEDSLSASTVMLLKEAYVRYGIIRDFHNTETYIYSLALNPYLSGTLTHTHRWLQQESHHRVFKTVDIEFMWRNEHANFQSEFHSVDSYKEAKKVLNQFMRRV